MTREELRGYVDEQRTLNNIPYHVYSALIDGMDTLEQEPCGDAVSRYDAVRIVQHNNPPKSIEKLRNLPSVTPTNILDKIRAEIFKYEADCRLSVDEYPSCKQCTDNVFGTIYRVLDKYRSDR